MKIHLTKKEYRLLLDILSISDWVMNSHIAGENPKSEPYRKLEQKFMSFAKDFDCDELIQYDKKYKAYSPTKKFEDEETSSIFIDEYDEDVFWEELCDRLAQRDMIKEKGIEKVKEMTPFDRLNEQNEIAAEYDKEFVKNGIRNLQILKTNKT